MSQRLDLKQSQNLALTPQMRQAIELLQMPLADIVNEIDRAVEANPMLEHGQGEDSSNPDPETDHDAAEATIDDSYDVLENGTVVEDNTLDTSYENIYDSDPSSAESLSWQGGQYNPDDSSDAWENQMSKPLTLRQHLEEQLGIEITNPTQRMIGLYLIDSLDANGWLPINVGTLTKQLGCDKKTLDGVLEILRSFDPVGVFSYNLKDCLALQLKEKDRLDQAMQTLLDHLDLLGDGDFDKLIQLCNVDEEDMEEMVEEIRALDPRPASAFEHIVAETLIPDLLMKRNAEGQWYAEANPEAVPKLLLKHDYHRTVSHQIQDKSGKSWLSQQWQEANWLVRALHQRMETMIKVSSEIIRHQNAFFTKGISALRPLILKEIAEIVEMHESTISRVCNGKFIHTPRGIFELRYFFSTALQSHDGAGPLLSAEAVRHQIRKLIHAESHGKVLSDDRITELLNTQKIDISRRTVAKYREAMQIPSSVIRRKIQKMQNSRFARKK